MSVDPSSNPLQNFEVLPSTLNTDEYWQPLADNKVIYPSDLTDRPDAIQRIVSTTKALEHGALRTYINIGEKLPKTTDKQVLRLVEDSRLLSARFKPANIRLRYRLNKTNKSISEILRQANPNYQEPTFADKARTIDESLDLYPDEAEEVVKYSFTKSARLRRDVYYAQYDEELDG